MPAVESALARKLGRFAPLGRDELAALAALEAERRPVAAGAELVREREAGQRAFILRDGWACCYKLLPDGGRQVIDVRLPGDFIGLRSVLLRTADHSAAAVTDAVVAEVPARRMLETFHALPRLGAAILWAASRDEAVVVEHLVGLGRRDALTRTAHFLVELGLRLELVGLGGGAGFACPLNQYQLADVLGLTAIHLNRVLRRLRERGLATFRDGRVAFHDLPRLRALAGHHGGYLDQAGGLAGLRADAPLTNDDQIISWSYDNEPENNHVLVIAAFIAECERRAMLIWISAAPVSVGYTPTLLLTARPGRDGPRPRTSIPRG